jgi:penicillin G amidase
MRVVKRLGQFLLAVLALLCVILAVYVWRSFPTLSGQQQVQGLQSSVRISRDGADITHIFAQTPNDAAFALGYTHAQERSWQLEFNRRIMHGQLSEILGPATLETDKLMRSLGIVRAAQRQLEGFPQDIKDQLAAYAAGINNFHATSGQALPPEFHLMRIQPGLWTATDSVGWAVMMALDLGGNWGTEFARLSAAQKLPTAKLWQLFPAYPGEQPASSVDLSKLYADLGVFNTQALATTTAAVTPTPDLIGGEVGNVQGKGSNNWVVAGSRTASGKPLLANDPHLGLSAPAIWYFARINVTAPGAAQPSTDVVGASLPGLPGVLLGRTAKVAWGFTNTGPDVQDLYLEQINPANPAQYKTPTGWADFASRSETIKIKGQPDLRYTVRSTRHGPVISDAQAFHGQVIDLQKYTIALRWSGLDQDNRTVVAGLNAQKAHSVDELFAAYADYHSPMQNVVAADTTGRIAYKAVGKVPVRSAANDIKGIAPAPGWDAKYDWAGWLPYAQTPSDDGTKGWVATANQRIHAPSYPHFLTQDWTTPQRFDRIEALLAASPKHDLASMQRIQADTVSITTQTLLPTLRATASNHPLAGAAQALLKDFQGDMRADSAAALVFATWADELTRGLIVPQLGEAKFKALYGKRHFRATVEQAMASNDAFWCGVKTCAVQSSEALGRALDRLAKLYSNDPAAWRWGAAHPARSIHKPLGNVAALAKVFDVMVPSGGDAWTVNVGQYWAGDAQPFHNRHAASLRSVFDLANLENSQFIYQTGQSGLVFSSRYRDMSTPWAQGGYRPLQLQGAIVGAELVLKP